MKAIKFFSGQELPVELHKVRMVQKLFLKPIEERFQAIKKADTILFYSIRRIYSSICLLIAGPTL